MGKHANEADGSSNHHEEGTIADGSTPNYHHSMDEYRQNQLL